MAPGAAAGGVANHNSINVGSAADGGQQFGDTTYTKVFVGGLAWETQKDTMKKYFEQFGEILEAVVITDKATGRSKGYGFVSVPSFACLIPLVPYFSVKPLGVFNLV